MMVSCSCCIKYSKVGDPDVVDIDRGAMPTHLKQQAIAMLQQLTSME